MRQIDKDLIDAVKADDVKGCVRAIRAGADVNIMDAESSLTPVMLAAARSRKMVNLLFKSGADINAKSKTGLTALSSAIYAQHRENVTYLISRGAEIDFDLVFFAAEGRLYDVATVMLTKLITQRAIELLKEGKIPA